MFDPTKPVQTVNKQKVRILCQDKIGGDPILGLVTYGPHGEELLMSWDVNGKAFSHCTNSHDLINVPEKRKMTVWVNTYSESGYDAPHPSKEHADESALASRLACIPIEIEYEV